MNWVMEYPTTYEIGVDEAGRGCFYGPVVAAAVVLPLDLPEKEWTMVRDSKKLSEKKRNMLATFIKEHALYYGIGIASSKVIDDMNILKASLKAMHRAIHEAYLMKQDKEMFEKIYVDGNHFIPYIVPNDDSTIIPYECIEQGDDKRLSIAAASILAKTHRDNLIIELCETQPILKNYDIHKNKGYGTKKHRDALKAYGPVEGHRYTYRPVRESMLL